MVSRFEYTRVEAACCGAGRVDNVVMQARPAEPIAYRARWLLPVDRPPIENGIVTIAGGRILAVGDDQWIQD